MAAVSRGMSEPSRQAGEVMIRHRGGHWGWMPDSMWPRCNSPQARGRHRLQKAQKRFVNGEDDDLAFYEALKTQC